MISQCMNEKEQFKLMRVKNDLRRIMVSQCVELIWPSSDSLIHVRIRSLWLRSCLFCDRPQSAFWNADSKRRSKTPLIQAIVRAQVNRKGVYMTSFKRGYNVILRSCFHQNQRFALTTVVNAHPWATFMLILRRRIETLIQNADPKRRSRKYCSCFPREEDDTLTEEGMSRNSRNV